MSFKDIVNQVKEKKPLKVIERDTQLPGEFDLHWDCKRGSDLIIFRLTENVTVRRKAAEYGFDVNAGVFTEKV